MSQLDRLKSATSRIELAEILGYKPSSLTAIIYVTPETEKYKTFEINKKSGGKRTIKAPVSKLKRLQSRLSNLLYQCLAEIERNRNLTPLSYGFRQGRSIVENASRHKRRRWVLNFDLEDFFPSFNFGRVRGFFLKDREFKLHPEVATTIAQIACDGNALPQGSPCSPIISELIACILDVRLVRLAKKYSVTYTRYADDISFSTNQKNFPSKLALPDDTDPEIWYLGDELVNKISVSGFSINQGKTRMHFRGSRQLVTGLVVNKKVNIRSEYYRRVRAMCHSLFQTGKYFKTYIPPNEEGDYPMPDLTDNLSPLEGMVRFIVMVTQNNESTYQNKLVKYEDLRAIEKLYRRLLFFKNFIVLDSPLIVTEGKTDPIYLRAAVRRRKKFHPLLGYFDKDKFRHGVRYLKFRGKTQEIMGLGNGGASNLRSIILDYKRNFHSSKDQTAIFNFRPMEHPVILLLDNDNGLNKIASTIKECFKIQFSRQSTDHFYHVTDNLYVVKIPEKGSQETCIENLFPKTWLNKKLNGKKFNFKGDITPETEFGKEVFAKSVIIPNSDKIDFVRFDPLLNRVVKVIEHYRKCKEQ